MRKNKSQGSYFYIIFGHTAKIFRLFVKKFSAGLSILHSTHPWQHFERFFLRQVNFVLSFSEIERKNFGLLAQFFWQGCQNCIIRVCRNNFEEKKLVWKKYNLNHFRILREKLSDFCEKVYGRVVKAASIVFIETIWELNSLKKKYFSQNHLRHWAGSFALVVKTFLTGFSRLHSKCPDDHFEEK